jgi:hypothetical protein
MLIRADRRQPATFQCSPGIRLRLQMGCVGHGPPHPVCLQQTNQDGNAVVPTVLLSTGAVGRLYTQEPLRNRSAFFPTSASSGAPGTLWSLFSFASVYRTPYRTVISVTSTQTVSVSYPYRIFRISSPWPSIHLIRIVTTITFAPPPHTPSTRWWQRG